MSSMPETLAKILEEFASLLRRQCFRCSAEGPRTHPVAVSDHRRARSPPASPAGSAGPSRLSLLLQSSSRKAELEDWADESDVESHPGCPSVVTARLLLEGLVGLSQRAEMVSRAVSGAAPWAKGGWGCVESSALAWPETQNVA